MSENQEDEDEREIIQVRRIIPKKKAAPPPPKQPDEELKEKAKELKKRIFRMQIALGIAVVFFIFLGLRAVGCFRNSSESEKSPGAPRWLNGSNGLSDVSPKGMNDVFQNRAQVLTDSGEPSERIAARYPRRAGLGNEQNDVFQSVGPLGNAAVDGELRRGAEKSATNGAVARSAQNFRDEKYLIDPKSLAPTRSAEISRETTFDLAFKSENYQKKDDSNDWNNVEKPSDWARVSEPLDEKNASIDRSRAGTDVVGPESRLTDRYNSFNPSGFRAVAPPENLRVVRVATWNLGAFDFAKLTDFNVGQKIAKMIQEFDIVALQGIRAKNLAVLDGLAYLIANDGGDYAYVASTPGRRDEISAFFFNANAVEIDRSTVSDVFDSRGRLSTPGLVAAFQTTGVDAQKRFTFRVVGCDLSNDISPNGEALADVYRTLQRTSGAFGVLEDDVLLVGDFGVAIQKIKELGAVPNLVATHVDKPTDVSGGSSVNILFDSIATTEYVERFGIVDLADYFGISDDEAAKIAPTRPVWADFSVYEGGAADFSAPTTASRPESASQ